MTADGRISPKELPARLFDAEKEADCLATCPENTGLQGNTQAAELAGSNHPVRLR